MEDKLRLLVGNDVSNKFVLACNNHLGNWKCDQIRQVYIPENNYTVISPPPPHNPPLQKNGKIG